jgi:peptidoglycan/LPS O-acetylase OafA/YrhL
MTASASTNRSTNRNTNRDTDPELKRERALSLAAGVLGLLMFVWGFLRWFNVGDQAHHQSRYSGYAFYTPTTAVIGFSLAAGLMAALGAMERRRGRGVPSAIPTALAATGLLLAIAVALGKGEISPTFGAKVGLEIGIYLAIATAAVQTIVLAMGLASRHDDRNDHNNSAARTADRSAR